MALSIINLLMIEDFAFVLMPYEENSQLICSADYLFGFYLVHVTETNFRTTCDFFIVISTDILCLYLIGSLLSVFSLYWTCYSICDQWCAQSFPFKEGQLEISTITNYSIDCNIRTYLSQHVFRCIFFFISAIYPAISWCHFLCYWPN